MRDFEADFTAALAAEAGAYHDAGLTDREATVETELTNLGHKRPKKERAVEAPDLERAVEEDVPTRRRTARPKPE